MKYKAKIIMGLALALAAIAVVIDHTRHRVPAPDAAPDAPSAPGYGGGADPAAALAGLVGQPPTMLVDGRSPRDTGANLTIVRLRHIGPAYIFQP